MKESKPSGSMYKNQAPKTTEACPNSMPYPVRRPENDRAENKDNNYRDAAKEEARYDQRLPD